MKAQIYTKPDKAVNEDYTSLVVAKGKTVYFEEVLNTPEITAIQRGVSFIKHQLNVDTTEIYPTKTTAEEIEKDTYINWCKVNATMGSTPDPEMELRCKTGLAVHQRWQFSKGGRE